jgi:hypothetical protein
MSSVVGPLLSALSEYTGYNLTLLAGRVETDPKVDVKVVAYADAVMLLIEDVANRFPGLTLGRHVRARRSPTGMQKSTAVPSKDSRVLSGGFVSGIQRCEGGERVN